MRDSRARPRWSICFFFLKRGSGSRVWLVAKRYKQRRYLEEGGHGGLENALSGQTSGKSTRFVMPGAPGEVAVCVCAGVCVCVSV